MCCLLAETGTAGNPNSFFRAQDIKDWAENWGLSLEALPGAREPSAHYLSAACKEGKGSTAVFGMRLMYESLPGLLSYLRAISYDETKDSDCLEKAFGPLVFIHLQRDDTVSQAVSLLRAEQSGLWHKSPDGSDIERLAPTHAPGYDFDRLHGHVARLTTEKTAWHVWFQQQAITPLNVSYDRLSNDPAGVLSAICERIGCSPQEAREFNIPTAKLRDATSAEWKARYQAQIEGLSDD